MLFHLMSFVVSACKRSSSRAQLSAVQTYTWPQPGETLAFWGPRSPAWGPVPVPVPCPRTRHSSHAAPLCPALTEPRLFERQNPPYPPASPFLPDIRCFPR